MKRLLLCFEITALILVLCFSCKTSTDQELINLNIEKQDFKTYDFGKIFMVEKVIYLEESENSLLSEIIHLKACNNELYISDNQHGIIYRFSDEGKFLNTIGKKGRGPGELQSMINFLVSDSGVIAIDYYKIVKFSLDGKFQKEINKSPGTFDILEQNGHYLIFNTLRDGDQIVLMDTSLKITSGFSPLSTNQVIFPMAGRGYLFKDNKNSFLTYPFSDTIFKLVDSIAKPYFIFGFNQRKLTNFNSLWGGNFDGDLSKYDYSVRDFITPDYLVSSLAHLNKTTMLLYNRNSKELLLIDSLKNGPDLINGSQLSYLTNTGLLYWRYDNVSADPTFRSIITESLTNDNPILIITSLN